ncbi:MAG TPA: ABC transporter ATP-binding protein [Acidimicrobiales bacterium]|nr:ABC transporter ATP-binding protein [Acidimicrobiales bacterium]
MIRIAGLSVSYGAVQALRDVTFDAPSGTVTAVIGANGAGKTTLLRSISGTVRPVAGEIDLDGTRLIGKRPENIARLGVGHVPEGRGVIEEFTVEENLRLGALHGKQKLQAGLDDQFDLFPVLGERRRQAAGTLSGGERQMLAMARALIAKPSVLLLDEPSLGLAPIVTADLMRTIKELCEDRKLTVILVEQDAMSALRVSERAVVLHVGRVAADDRSEVVAADENLKHYYLGMTQ